MVTVVNEFSHNVQADAIGNTPFQAKFKADAKAREQLAKRFGILSIESVEGQAVLTRQPDGFTIHVTGRFTADVTQACVATLEPVAEHVSESFEAWFLDESQVTSFMKARKQRQAPGADADDDIDENPMPEDHEDPEPVVDGVIDVGEIVAQHLSLALDPFPHSAGAEASGPIGDEASLKPESPFAGLKDLLSK